MNLFSQNWPDADVVGLDARRAYGLCLKLLLLLFNYVAEDCWLFAGLNKTNNYVLSQVQNKCRLLRTEVERKLEYFGHIVGMVGWMDGWMDG